MNEQDYQAHQSVSIVQRLQALVPTMTHICKTTATPSFCAGVLHKGKTIFTHHEGVTDVSTDTASSQVNLDTVYLLGSLTKAFISASCGILVDQGRLKWEEPLATYLPFQQKSDPVISSRANLLDALSHSTGFPRIDISWYGAQGESIVPSKDLLHVANNIPVFPDFRAKFHYTNWMYALAGRIIESVGIDDTHSGWGKFVSKYIFKPLGMDRSCSNRSDLPDSNFTEPHTALDNQQPGRLPVPDFSDKTLTGASAAVWSTVPDMLRWTNAILERLATETGSIRQSAPAPQTSSNPLRQISTILGHRFRVTEDTVNENSYGLGWACHLLPSKHLGWLSINGPQPQHVIGAESAPRLCFYHGGQITGYLNTVCMFPETHSAVIVLTNAQGAGDCSDWVAQAIVQELFDLQPRLDFRSIVEESAQIHLSMFSKMEKEYEQHRKKDTACPPQTDIVGIYYNDPLCNKIEILQDGGELVMQRNDRKSQQYILTHYHDDVFGFLPASREEMQLRCLVDYFVYEQFLLSFDRGSGRNIGRAKSLSWRMQDDLPPITFARGCENS